MLNKNNLYVLKIRAVNRKFIIKEIKRILFLYKVKEYKIYKFIKTLVKKENNKKIFLKKNLLPGYLIINLLLDRMILYKIKKINGVINFLNEGIDNFPRPLKYNDIKNLIKESKNKTYKRTNIKYFIGESVKINNGVCIGLTGVIEKIYKKKNKILLSVYIMGRKIFLTIESSKIEKF
ncbi:MAG: hypothetical protein NHF96_00030 [Candidatus Shikimatogenerans bostrichidophilus]|nr:MAG: hypothetical protein NHF96_00030 [Candidatus Shikimatogenerans bostrichidophilus]